MTVTDLLTRRPLVRIEVRDRLEQLAEDYRNDLVGPIRVAVTLLRLRSGLSLRDRRAWWQELCDALTEHETAEYGTPDWGQIDPDLRDPEVWAEWCRGRVDEALWALTGGSR